VLAISSLPHNQGASLMPATSESERYRKRKLREAEEKGLHIISESGVYYTINGRTTKVLYSTAASPWFRIPISLYSSRDEGHSPIDVFLLLCEKPDIFYAIPRQFIVDLKRKLLTRPSSSPTFYIDVASDRCHFLKRTQSIRPYRNSWKIFKRTPTALAKANSFESQVRKWLQNNFAKNGKAYIHDEKTIIGASGNAHKIDHVIYQHSSSRNSITKRILIEVKNPGRGGKAPTQGSYYVHMIRAFVALGDFDLYRSWPKFVLVPNRGKYGKFDFERFFNPMNIRLVAFNDRAERKSLGKLLRSIIT
jgi:hypothetical protein